MGFSCRRVVRPWLGLKMIDLNDMIISQLKERDGAFPNVKKGILVPMVCIVGSSFIYCIHTYLYCSSMNYGWKTYISLISCMHWLNEEIYVRLLSKRSQ